MKRLICLALMIVLTLLCGCTATPTSSDGKLNIVCTIFPQYDFARAIAGQRANVIMLLSPGTDSHSYDPTPADMLAVKRSDMLLYIGPYMETWAQAIIDTVDVTNTAVVRLDEGVELLCDGHEHHSHNHSEHAETYNGHIWTDPIIAAKMVSTITQKLCEIDPEGARYYRANAADYTFELMQLDGRLSAITASAERSTVLFAGKFSFSYMFERYGLSHIAAYSSCSAHGEPEAYEMMRIIQSVRQGTPCVYYPELTEPRVADTVSRETGCDSLLLHSCHNLTREEWDAGEGYVSLMNKNIDNLAKGLGTNAH